MLAAMPVVPEEAQPEKENSQGPAKRMRKSMPSDGRRKSVSFGSVKVTLYEKETAEESPQRAPRGGMASSSSSAAAATHPIPVAAAPPPVPVASAAPQPQLNAAAAAPAVAAAKIAASPRRSPRVAKSQQKVPSSPAASEASDVSFMSAESFHSAMDGGEARGLGTPSLSGLLDEDERAEVPALAQLLAQDLSSQATQPAPVADADADDTMAMDMTIAVGGILSGGAAAAPPAASSTTPSLLDRYSSLMYRMRAIDVLRELDTDRDGVVSLPEIARMLRSKGMSEGEVRTPHLHHLQISTDCCCTRCRPSLTPPLHLSCSHRRIAPNGCCAHACCARVVVRLCRPDRPGV